MKFKIGGSRVQYVKKIPFRMAISRNKRSNLLGRSMRSWRTILVSKLLQYIDPELANYVNDRFTYNSRFFNNHLRTGKRKDYLPVLLKVTTMFLAAVEIVYLGLLKLEVNTPSHRVIMF
jgi:hypothetical protein